MPEGKWTITIGGDKGFDGFCPAYFKNSYPFYANSNQASAMQNIDLTDPNVLTQGSGMANLTAGDENGAITTIINSILKISTTADASYAIGSNKLYRISSSAVSNAGDWPHTIDKGGVTDETGEDMIYHKSYLYYFYNHSGSAGDIGQYNLGSTFDDDWASTVPTGKGTLQDASHQAIKGGDDDAYFANGNFIGAIRENGNLELEALDFWTNSEVVSLTWNGNRVIAAVNRPNLTGSNFSQSGVYTWDGTSSTWEGDPIEVSGKIGALYTKNGATFVWWKDGTGDGAYSFGYVNGTQLTPIKRYSGSLPSYSQVGEYKGFLCWVSDNKVYCWGGKDVELPVVFFQFMQGKQATIGAIASPFGDLLISSHSGSNYSLAKPSGYTVSSTWKSKAFNVSGISHKSQIDLIQVETEEMSSGAKVDFTLTYDQGKSTQSLTQIAYAASKPTRHKILNRGYQVEDFRLDINFANGSVTNNVAIRSIEISGHYITNN